MRSMPRLLSMVTPVKAEVPRHTLPLAPDVLHRTPASEEASHPPRASLWVETISDSTRARRRDASISLSRGRWIRRRRPPADKNLQRQYPPHPAAAPCLLSSNGRYPKFVVLGRSRRWVGMEEGRKTRRRRPNRVRGEDGTPRNRVHAIMSGW